MKVFARAVPVFVLCILAYHVCQAEDELENNVINSECSIPNQIRTKGVCVKRQNCLEYEDLFNVTDLTTERLSFIINLDCGFDFEDWKTLICCPTTGNSYKYAKSFDLERE